MKPNPLVSSLARAVLPALLAAGVPGSALAQSQDVDLPKHDAAPAGDRFFGVPSPFVPGKVAFHGGVTLDYAHAPLSIAHDDGERVGFIVEHQLLLDVNVALALWNRVEINALMPFALLNQGEGTFHVGDLVYTSPNEPGIGDLRVGARVRLFGEYHDPFQLGLGGYVWIPIATDDDFVGDGARGQVHLLMGGRADRFIWSTMAGATFQETVDIGPEDLSHRFVWGAGVGAFIDEHRLIQLTAETSGALQLIDPTLESINAEALFGIKGRVASPVELGMAGGPGFSQGIGTPDARAVFTIYFTPDVPPPAKPEPTPPPPKPEPKPVPAPAPKDLDGDGITDDSDACPAIAGVASEDPKQNGCPPDSDGDGFRDPDDACPREKGVDDPDRAKRGCPKLVRVTENEIVILEQVQFETGRAAIRRESNALLDSVAAVLAEHPEIKRLEVQGHTDARGPRDLNARLSQERADAVRKALESRGTAPERLVSKGYGPDKPIDTNDTDEGRQKNRRVQFLVLEKTKGAQR